MKLKMDTFAYYVQAACVSFWFLSHFFIERVIVLISHPWIDLAYDIETHLKINTRMCLSPSHVFCLDVLLPLY